MFCVLASVFDGEKSQNLDEFFESIWSIQTLKPSQIVLVLDGFINKDLRLVVEKWRIKLKEVLVVVELPVNMGLAYALNQGLKFCSFELVARMDTDDIALPIRFEIQTKYMLDNPSIAASSGVIEELDVASGDYIPRKLPLNHDELTVFAKSRSPLSHPASMFRKSVVLALGGYPELRNAQDYALWSLLIINGYQLGNLPHVLIRMRAGTSMMNRRGLLYLKREYKLLLYQRSIGFLSRQEFLFNLLWRSFLRLSPLFIKQLLYKIAR